MRSGERARSRTKPCTRISRSTGVSPVTQTLNLDHGTAPADWSGRSPRENLAHGVSRGLAFENVSESRRDDTTTRGCEPERWFHSPTSAKEGRCGAPGWAVFDGVLTLILGVLLWAEWPVSAIWFVGLALGITLILRGWTTIMFALAIRALTDTVPISRAA